MQGSQGREATVVPITGLDPIHQVNKLEGAVEEYSKKEMGSPAGRRITARRPRMLHAAFRGKHRQLLRGQRLLRGRTGLATYLFWRRQTESRLARPFRGT